MIKLTWNTSNFVLDSRTFKDSLSAQRFVRKQIAEMPQCHAKWQPARVTVYSGSEVHSTFNLQPIKE